MTAAADHTDRISLLPGLGASRLLPVLLSTLNTNFLWMGATPLLLVGAWTGGSIWPGGQLRTRITQWQPRSQQVLGQCLALVLLTIGATFFMFAVTVLSAKLVALALPHVTAIQPAGGTARSPRPHTSSTAAGAYALAATTYALLGLALGTALRNPGAAIGFAFLWVQGVEGPLTQLLPQLHGTILRIVEALPDGGLGRLTTVSGLAAPGENPVATISVNTAVLQLIGWSAVSAIVTIWLTRRNENA